MLQAQPGIGASPQAVEASAARLVQLRQIIPRAAQLFPAPVLARLALGGPNTLEDLTVRPPAYPTQRPQA